jgi:hypothetical protein
MNKRLIQAFIILIVILFGVSLVSEADKKVDNKESIDKFEESVSNNQEIENGSMVEVNVVKEDSSNLISNVNAKVASVLVGGLNKLFSMVIKVVEGVTN